MATHLGLPSPSSAARPASSYSSNFNLPSSSSPSSSNAGDDNNVNDDEDDAPLPFPTALARRDFLVPDFDPAAYLSALHQGPTTRHQTLEDLRSELRDRSSAISAELLELVNSNYTSFLGLGDELKGGEDRVEDVRVALLGFKRAVEEIQGRVRERMVEAGALNDELRGVKSGVELGRRMLELDERVADLEVRLAVGGGGGGNAGNSQRGGGGQDDEYDSDWDDDFIVDDKDESDEEDHTGFVGSSPTELATLAKDYVLVEKLAESLGWDLPFVKKTEERMMRCRNTILLDTSTALKEARRAGAKGHGRIVKLLGVYRTLKAETEAVQTLKRN